jgi:hypothetical protein
VTNIDETLPPEKELNLKHTYKGVGDSDIYWQPADASAIGRLELLSVYPDAPATTQAYAWTTFYSKTARDAVLLVGERTIRSPCRSTEPRYTGTTGGMAPARTDPCVTLSNLAH